MNKLKTKPNFHSVNPVNVNIPQNAAIPSAGLLKKSKRSKSPPNPKEVRVFHEARKSDPFKLGLTPMAAIMASVLMFFRSSLTLTVSFVFTEDETLWAVEKNLVENVKVTVNLTVIFLLFEVNTPPPLVSLTRTTIPTILNRQASSKNSKIRAPIPVQPKVTSKPAAPQAFKIPQPRPRPAGSNVKIIPKFNSKTVTVSRIKRLRVVFYRLIELHFT